MTTDIFKLFRKSIETVTVKKQPRGTYNTVAPEYEVDIDAIVKRRKGFSEDVEESEDFSNNTSFHHDSSDSHTTNLGKLQLPSVQFPLHEPFGYISGLPDEYVTLSW